MSVRISCCVDVPNEYISGARYALKMILYPFRVSIRWVGADESATASLGADGKYPVGIYYGINPDRAPGSFLRVGLQPDTVSFFVGSRPHPDTEETVRIGDDVVPALFRSSGDTAFDPVAATFYFLSGWQERYAAECDEHGRFRSVDALQDRLGQTVLPFVDIYRTYFVHLLRTKGIELDRKTWEGSDWAFCPTHDIDYVRKWRPGIFFREIVERAIGNQEKESPRARIRRVTRAVSGLFSPSDPYRQALERMLAVVTGRGGTSTFFFKTAARAPHDVGYSTRSTFLHSFFRRLKVAGCEIGLHPSYHAFNHPDYLAEERARLRLDAGVDVASVRMHYLRLSVPTTARLSADAGFTLDSTLGFSDRVGFRNGTCLPFQLYDLDRGAALDIFEMPLTLMESALFNRMSCTPEQATGETVALMETCRKYGGVFVGLWHNILWDEAEFPLWGEHFERTVDRAVRQEAYIGSLRRCFNAWQ
jgi:Family of unknown function (DUF7033)